jgi:hypothetical protein
VFNIIDFKTTRPERLKAASKENIAAGTQLQLPLYVLAAQMVLTSSGAVAYEADYWAIRGKGFGGKREGALQVHAATNEGLRPLDTWAEVRSNLETKLVELVRSVRNGEFPVDSLDDECTSTCAFRTVCRIAHARNVGKTRPAAHEKALDAQSCRAAERPSRKGSELQSIGALSHQS